MKILVTGGCGFVGSRLVPALLERDHEVVVYDTQWFGNELGEHPNLKVVRGDVRDTDRIPLRGMEAVIHLANIANDPSGDLDPKLTWEVNVLASMGLAEAAIQAGVRQLIYASSGSVYGVKDEIEVTEELPLVPISDYNKTKMISERVLLSYADLLPIQCVRPATVCGVSPRMRLDLSVNLLTMQALEHKRITVWGGDQTRPNIHIEDMVRVYLHFLELGDSVTGVFNAGFENCSILSIAERAAERVGAEVVVTESNDPRSYRLNSDRLLATGFEPRSTIADGIEDVVRAYRSGALRDEDRWYNLRVMRALGIGNR